MDLEAKKDPWKSGLFIFGTAIGLLTFALLLAPEIGAQAMKERGPRGRRQLRGLEELRDLPQENLSDLEFNPPPPEDPARR